MASTASTHLMFTEDASAALDLYSATFPSFRVERVAHVAHTAAARSCRADS